MAVRIVKGAEDILSNFYISDSPLLYKGILFRSVEHAYQSLKAVSHGQHNLAQRIKDSATAFTAKMLARCVQPTNKWFTEREKVMEDLISCKVTCVPEFRHSLLDTGICTITHPVNDTFWGTRNGCGQDRFAKILMKKRQALQETSGKNLTWILYKYTETVEVRLVRFHRPLANRCVLR